MAVVFLLVDKDIEIHGPNLSTHLYGYDRDPSQHDGRPSCPPPPRLPGPHHAFFLLLQFAMVFSFVSVYCAVCIGVRAITAGRTSVILSPTVVFSLVSVYCGAFFFFEFAVVSSFVSVCCASLTASQAHSLATSQPHASRLISV